MKTDSGRPGDDISSFDTVLIKNLVKESSGRPGALNLFLPRRVLIQNLMKNLLGGQELKSLSSNKGFLIETYWKNPLGGQELKSPPSNKGFNSKPNEKSSNATESAVSSFA